MEKVKEMERSIDDTEWIWDKGRGACHSGKANAGTSPDEGRGYAWSNLTSFVRRRLAPFPDLTPRNGAVEGVVWRGRAVCGLCCTRWLMFESNTETLICVILSLDIEPGARCKRIELDVSLFSRFYWWLRLLSNCFWVAFMIALSSYFLRLDVRVP